MNYSCLSTQALRLSALGAALGLGLSAQAAEFYQTENMAINTHWHQEFWTNATETTAIAPSAGNTYINDVGGTRTPTTSYPDEMVFAGDSLTLKDGAYLQLKSGSTYIPTVNLIMESGTTLLNGGGKYLDGTLTGSGDITFDTTTYGRDIVILSPLSADNTFSSIEIAGVGMLVITNAANTFTGTWNVASGSLKCADTGQAAAFSIGSGASLDLDADFYSETADLTIAIGGSFALDQDMTVDTATVWGEALDAGTYDAAALTNDAYYGSAFAGTTGSLEVLSSQGGGDEGLTIYQTDSMPVGVDWNDSTYWDNGEAPVSTNNYVNDNGGASTNSWATRTPTSGSETFGGASLTFTNGAYLNIKGNGPWTVNNLNVWAGSSIGNGGAYSATLSGTLNLKGTGSVVLDAQTAGRTTTVSSLLTADETITNIIIQVSQIALTNTAEQASTAGFTINGLGAIANTFDGTWVVNSGFLAGEDFGSGSFLVTDLGLLDFDYSYYNKDADLTIEANPTNSAQGGMLLLDQNILVGSATIWGETLAEGSYSGAELKAHAVYGAAIDPDSDDTAILAVGANASLPVYQTVTHSSSVTWESSNSWDNAQSPSTGFDYVNNTDGMTTRNPNVSGVEAVFGGKSLTLSNGAQLKLQHNDTSSISNLTMYAGTIGGTAAELRTVNTTGLNGDLTIAGSGSFLCDFEKDTRSMTVGALVTVADTVTNIVIRGDQAEITDGTVSGFIFTNTNNTFAGTWEIQEGYLKGPGVGQGSFTIGEGGYLEIGAAYSNDLADLTIEANPTNELVFGQMQLDYNMTVGTATIDGTQLDAGEYTATELISQFGDMIASTDPDNVILKVTFVPDVPEIGDIEVSMDGTDLLIGFTATNYAVYTVLADDDLSNDPAWPYTIDTVSGIDGPVTVTNDTSGADQLFYKVEADLAD